MALGRARAVLGMNKSKIKDFIVKSQNVYNLMSADPRFAATPVAYATVAQQIADLTKANQSVVARLPGMVPTRDQRRDVLFASMESLRGFAQMLADASPAQASILITAAGMLVWAQPVRSKAILAAETILPSGTVALQANATLLLAGMGSKRPTFNWSYTLDGETFSGCAGDVRYLHPFLYEREHRIDLDAAVVTAIGRMSAAADGAAEIAVVRALIECLATPPRASSAGPSPAWLLGRARSRSARGHARRRHRR